MSSVVRDLEIDKIVVLPPLDSNATYAYGKVVDQSGTPDTARNQVSPLKIIRNPFTNQSESAASDFPPYSFFDYVQHSAMPEDAFPPHTFLDVEQHSRIPEEVPLRPMPKVHLMNISFLPRLQVDTRVETLNQYFEKYGTRRLLDIVHLLHDTAAVLEDEILNHDPDFVPHLNPYRKPKEWGRFAHEMATFFADRRLERTLYSELENFYEALRLVISSRQYDTDVALAFLYYYSSLLHDPHDYLLSVLSPTFNDAFEKLRRESLRFLRSSELTSHSRFYRLAAVIQDMLQSSTSQGVPFNHHSPTLQLIVQVGHRITAHVVAAFIKETFTLNAEPYYSPSSVATPTLSLSEAKLRQIKSRYDSGLCHVLVIVRDTTGIPRNQSTIYFDSPGARVRLTVFLSSSLTVRTM